MTNKRLYILLFVLLFATLGNILVHWQSPSYRYYKNEFENVRRSMVSYTNDVSRVFAIATTNLMYQFVNVAKSGSRSSDSLSSNVVDSIEVPSPVNLKFDYFIVAGNNYVRVNGWDYRVGDRYHGEIIEYISPDSFRTSGNIYFNSKEVGNSSFLSTVLPASQRTNKKAELPKISIGNPLKGA